MTTNNLVVELRVEELPPKALKPLGEAFAAGIAAALAEAGLIDSCGAAPPVGYATPRRLAVRVPDVRARADDRKQTKKLVPVGVGLDADKRPTQALIKKLASLGLAPDAGVYAMPDGKANALFVDMKVTGLTLAEGLQRALDETLARLPIPKVMSYQLADGWSSVQFVRPAHGLVALHGAEVVPVQALGLRSGRETLGHRFLSQGPIRLGHADDYAERLRVQGKVIASFADRRESIRGQLERLRLSAESDGVIAPESLLDEVTALVEWPVVYECHFDADYLQVPQECLVLTMQTNQKYFACTLEGALVNRFLVVSNIETDDAGAIVRGNERVVRPRLADARFFFDQDRKRTLESRVPALDKVVYHGRLGSQGERVQRVRALARAIGERLGGAALAQQADRAAWLAKADLLTEMVGEFPELQGTMGWYYARHDGEDDEVALAIADQYKPRFAGDELPRRPCGLALALADKLETLVGLCGIGQFPTGDKDPFALRRHAAGVIRMLSERRLPLDLPWLVSQAAASFGALIDLDAAAVHGFLRERALTLFTDKGFTRAEVEAALTVESDRFDSTEARLEAVRSFSALPEAAALAAANKRVGNILKKSAPGASGVLQTALLVEPGEKGLAAAIARVAPAAEAAFDAGDYAGSLRALAALKLPVDVFFDQVMVNADDAALRANRLALLGELHAAMNRVADLSRLAA